MGKITISNTSGVDILEDITEEAGIATDARTVLIE